MLREISADVTKFDKRLETLIDDMAETMDKKGGVGIAALQVGKSLRIFLVKYNGQIKEYVNPRITFEEGKQMSLEDCLSVPGISGVVQRPNHIKGEAVNKNVYLFSFDVTGDEARIICHEYDRLYGKLFIDKDRVVRTFTNKQIVLLETASIVGIVTFVVAVGYSIYRCVSSLLFG